MAAMLLAVLLQPQPLFALTEVTEDPQGPTTAEAQALQKELEAAKPRLGSNPANPQEKTSCNILSDGFGCVIYWVLDIVSDFFINILLAWVMLFFESAVVIARTSPASLTFVKTGFAITLGIANAFFVLILLWIAIATIFDFEPYTARQLLPKLIIAALLINFSLPIGNAFINLSNGIADIFYDRLQRPLTASEQEQQGVVGRFLPLAPISSRVLLISKFAAVKDFRPDPNAPNDAGVLQERTGNNITRDCYSNLSPIPGWSTVVCLNTIFQSGVQIAFRTPSNDVQLLGTALTAVLAKLTITPILIFVLLAGTIFLIARTLSLAFLLVLGPLAFLFMILPATQPYYRQWWERLAKWSFFFPAFMFFVFLSLQTGSSFAEQFVNAGGPQNQLPAFLQYIIIIGLLLLSLMMANQMSIYGAATVTGWGSGLAGATGRWAKGTGKLLGGGVAGAVLGSAVGQALSSRRATRWALRPIEAARAAGQRVEEERAKTALQRRGLAAKVSPQYRWALMQGMAPEERADFIRQSKPHELRSVLNTIDPQQRIALHNEMRRFDLDGKLVDAAQDLTSAIEMESGVAQTDGRFQEAFNSWLTSATPAEIQKRVSANDIKSNANLHAAITTPGVLGASDIQTIAHSGEKTSALRDHFIDLGGRANYDSELTLGYSEVEAAERAWGRAAAAIGKTNPGLGGALAGNTAMQFNFARSRALGRKTSPTVVVVPGGGTT